MVQDFHKETVPGDREPLLEARRLLENQTYEFWVTASTAVGEGPPSVKVKQRPVSRGECEWPGQGQPTSSLTTALRVSEELTLTN